MVWLFTAGIFASSTGYLPLVAIDAGHGGAHAGAIGVCGLQEKDVTLAIAKELAAILAASQKARALLIRSDDRDIDLEERAHTANRAKAALLLSIHANSSTRPEVRGVETFFLSQMAGEHRLPSRHRKLVARENQGKRVRRTQHRDSVATILADMALDGAHRESQRFAVRVQQALQDRINPKARGVLQAPFIVLKGATMAAALVEVGFLTNPRECDLLREPEHQQRIAKGLASAVLEHLGNEAPLIVQR